MSWFPNNRFQQPGGYNNQFRPRPHFTPRPRFESSARGHLPNPNFSRNFSPYGPRATSNYRTPRPFHNQPRPFRPTTTRTSAASSNGIKTESQSTQNQDKEEKSKQNEEQKEKAQEPTASQNEPEKSETVKADDPVTTGAKSGEPVTETEAKKSEQLDNSKTEQHDDVAIKTSQNEIVTEQKGQTPDSSAESNETVIGNIRTEVNEDNDMRVKLATETEQSDQLIKEPDKSVREENKNKDDSGPKERDKNEAKPQTGNADDDDDEENDSDEDTGFCKYCQKSFSSTSAYYTHTRGIIHINRYMKAKEEKQGETTVSATSERDKESGKAQDTGQFLSAAETKQNSEQQNKQLSDMKTFSGQDQNKKGSQNTSKTGQFEKSDRTEDVINSEEMRGQVVESYDSWTQQADRLLSETGFNSKQKQNSGMVDDRVLSSRPSISQRFEKRPISRQTNQCVEDSGLGQFGLALSDVGSGSGDDDEHKVGQFDSVPGFEQNYERDKTNYDQVEKYIDRANREKVDTSGSVYNRSYVKETDRNVYGDSSGEKNIGQFYGSVGREDNSYNNDSKRVGYKQANSYSGQNLGSGSSYPGQMQEHSNTYPGLGRGQNHRYSGQGRGQGDSYLEQGSRYPGLSGRQDTSYAGRGRGQGNSFPGQGNRYTSERLGQDSSNQVEGYQQDKSYEVEGYKQSENYVGDKYKQAESNSGKYYEKGNSYGDSYLKEGDQGDSYLRESEQDDYQSGKHYEQGSRYSGKDYDQDNSYQGGIYDQDNSYQGEGYEQDNSYQGEGYEQDNHYQGKSYGQSNSYQGNSSKDSNIDSVQGDYSGGQDDYNDIQDDYYNDGNGGLNDGQSNYYNVQDDYYNNENDDPYDGQDYYDGQYDYNNEQGEHNDGQGYSDRGQFYAVAGYKTKQGMMVREEKGTNEEAADEEEEEEEDTSYCKYCKLPFSSSVAYHAHTRGLQHTTLIMEEKRKKGDQRFRKEKVAPEVLKVEIPKPKPEVNPEDPDIPDDYDFETNWMNLDDELIKRLKKSQASKRDLTPDDIGKKQFSEDFCCALCNVQCTSALTFKMHIEGKQHKNNLDRLESGSVVKKKKTPGVVFTSVEGDDVESQFNAQIANYTENALMGLEYITEFQKPDPKAPCRYVCNLCEAKCDGSTVLAHVMGVKHKLCYFREKHFKLYEHLTKYTSKKKRSEMNENLEDFARQIEAEEGRKKVRVKIELEAGSGEEDLNEIMTRMSKALKDKMMEIEKGSEAPSKPLEIKKGQFGLPKQEILLKTENKRMKPPPKAGGNPRPAPVRKERSPPPVGPRYGPPSRPLPPLPQRGYYDSPRDPYMAEPYRPGAYGREDRADLYSRDSVAYRRDTFEYERESDYLDLMLDKHRYSDPYLERRRLEDLIDRQRHLREMENRRLDDLLLDRHRLVDPTLETRRLEDILQRKRKIEEAERLRFEDIMRRKRLLEENDIEKLRVQRYEKLMKTSQEQDVTAAREVERPSLEELIARRRMKNLTAGQENRPLADESLLPNSYSSSSEVQSTTPQPLPAYQQPQIAPIQASKPVTGPTVQNPVQVATGLGVQGTSQTATGIGAHGPNQVFIGPDAQWSGSGATALVGQGHNQVVTALGGQGPSQVATGLGLQGPSQVVSALGGQGPSQLATGLGLQGPSQLVTTFGGQEPSQVATGLGLQRPSQVFTTHGGHTQQSASAALSTAQKVAANKELQEELAKNPGVNIGELLGNLSSSMIATEDDAAMALQISNTLTQALLKFRLQHATKQLSEVRSQSKQSESKSIPGLGSSVTDSGKFVPAFLRTVTVTPKHKVHTPVSATKSSDSKGAQFSPQNSAVSVTDSKRVHQPPKDASQPQTDLLKSIREQAQQLQAQISSRVKTSSSVSKSGIQAQSQFVHGQTSNTSHTPTSSPAQRQIYVSGKKSSQESKDTASPSQTTSAWERQIYISGKKSSGGPQDTASSVPQTTSSTDRHVYLSGKKPTGGSQDTDMSQTTPPVERHVYLSGIKSSLRSQETSSSSQMASSAGNPATHAPYDQWYNTMYGQKMYSYYPMPAPPVPLGVPPPPPPTSENT